MIRTIFFLTLILAVFTYISCGTSTTEPDTVNNYYTNYVYITNLDGGQNEIVLMQPYSLEFVTNIYFDGILETNVQWKINNTNFHNSVLVEHFFYRTTNDWYGERGWQYNADFDYVAGNGYILIWHGYTNEITNKFLFN